MSIHTQGSQLFIKTPDKKLLEIGGILDPEFGNPTRKKIDVTPLSETEMEQEEEGLYESAESSFTIIFDPTDPSHKKIYDLSFEEGIEDIEYFLCCGQDTKYGAKYDATAVPTIDSSSGVVTLPKSRHVAHVKGGKLNFNMDIKGQDVIKAPVSFKQKERWKMNWATA